MRKYIRKNIYSWTACNNGNSPIEIRFVRASDMEKPIQQTAISGRGSTRWVSAYESNELIDIPSDRIWVKTTPWPPEGLTIWVDAEYYFEGDKQALNISEEWGHWELIEKPIPVGDYIKGIATNTIRDDNGVRYKLSTFGRQAFHAHTAEDQERLNQYMREKP